MEIRNYWADIEDSSGNKIGAGPVAISKPQRPKPLSQSGELSFEVSPADPNLSAIAKKLIAVIRYIDKDNTIQEFGALIIDRSTIKTDGTGLITFVVSGMDISRELTYRSVRDLQIGDATGGDSDGPDQIMVLAPGGWSITNGSTLQDVYIKYDGQTVLNSLITIGEGIGEHWRLGTGRNIVWLNTINEFVSSGVRAMKTIPDGNAGLGVEEVALIKSLEEIEESIGIVTRVYPRGAGNGDAVTRLASLTDSPPAGYTVNIAQGYIEDDSAVIAYGVIEREVDFKNLSPISNSAADKELAAGMLLKAGIEFLRRFSEPQRFYQIELGKLDQVLNTGTTIKIVYQNEVNGNVILDIDEDLNIIEVIDSIGQEGVFTAGIKVATIDRMPMTDQDITVGQLEQGRVVSTHAQLNANAREVNRDGTMDDSNPHNVHFWFGNEVASIRNIKLRFIITPLRSTVKSVAGSSTTTPAGGASTTPSGGSSTTPSGGASTTPSGGSSTTPSGGSDTSGAGGGTTETSTNEDANHAHPLTFTGNTLITNVGLDSLGNWTKGAGGASRVEGVQDTSHQHDVTLIDHQHTTPAHSHNTPNHTHNTPSHTHNTPAHTHDTPDHQHTFTPNITTVYGIFEETAGNTLTESDLVIKINGVTFTGSVDPIAGDWYEADITDELIDSTFTPDQANNVIQYSTAVAKTATITTSITIVDNVQAVTIL